ncbi:hypothetical protein WAI453_003209 [Rhynchosporium graminicola]
MIANPEKLYFHFHNGISVSYLRPNNGSSRGLWGVPSQRQPSSRKLGRFGGLEEPDSFANGLPTCEANRRHIIPLH